MKKILILFLFFQLTLNSCDKTVRKSDLFGMWESFETHHTKVAIGFYKDSLTLYANGGGFHTVSEWSIDSSKLYLKNVTLIQPYTKLTTVINERMIYRYELNPKKDTLKLFLLSDKPNDYSLLKKVKKNPFTD